VNIRFEYMYRDAGNYKNYGSVIFSNKRNVTAQEIRRRILLSLGDPSLFSARSLKVPELYFDNFPYDPDLDHCMHEFVDVEEIEGPPMDLQSRDIQEVLEELQAAEL